ncbi:MAG: hypothetical protein OXT09_16000 [Myxococcales bacterium]|nr:hypothetical protein [Myxococcales bacterium]
MPSDILLGRGPIYEIVERGRTARCTVVNAPDVSGAEGARCASEMHAVLTGRVLVRRSFYRGLVFDVRCGPAAFGPKTRVSLEQIFDAAVRADKHLAVLVGESPTQLMQFTNLAREHAPQHARVLHDDGEAEAWADGSAAASRLSDRS